MLIVFNRPNYKLTQKGYGKELSQALLIFLKKKIWKLDNYNTKQNLYHTTKVETIPQNIIFYTIL